MLQPKLRISAGVRKFTFSTHRSETSIIKFAIIFGVADGSEKTKRKRQEMKNVAKYSGEWKTYFLLVHNWTQGSGSAVHLNLFFPQVFISF